MKAEAMALSALFVMGGMVFSEAHAQSTTQTAYISATGAVTNNNGWISSVTLHNDANTNGAAYVVSFAGGAPAATSCNVSPASSGVNSRMINPVSRPNVLVVSFTPAVAGSPPGNVATDFTLSCAVAAPVAPASVPTTTTTTTTTRTTTTMPAPLQGVQSASISSTAAVSNNNGWITNVTYLGSTGYPPNAYVVEMAGRSPGAANCQVSPMQTEIGGYTFNGGVFDGSDGNSVIVRYLPPANVPGGSSIPAAMNFTLTCTFPGG